MSAASSAVGDDVLEEGGQGYQDAGAWHHPLTAKQRWRVVQQT